MRRVVIIVLAGLAALVALVIALLATRDDAKPEPRPAVTAQRMPRATDVRTVETIAPGVQFDDDPPGVLRLEGQVIDLEDKPRAHATVVIDANPPREVHTEDDGSFAFDGLTPRTYRLSARAGDDISAPTAIRLTHATEPVILRVHPMARVEVTITGEGDRPLRGARVELRDLVPVTAVTDAAGKITLAGVGAGWHVIKASADGHASAFREVATTGDPTAVASVVIALRAGATVSGTVVDTGGQPIEGARVVPEHTGHVDDFYDARFDAVRSDAKGSWRITGLPRETTRIRAYHADYAPAASSPIALADDAAPRHVTIVLERGVRIRGRVVDASRAPVPGAEVRISADTVLTGQVRRVAADADGAFTMGGLPRRLMYDMAASEGATSETLAVDLARPATALELRLDRGAQLTGIVVTSAGLPVAEARVTALRERTDSATDQLEARLRGTESAIAGTDGRFAITGLAKGSYLVRAIRPGSPTELAHARVGLSIETGTDARIVVDDLSTLTGKLAFPDGKAPARFAIRLGTAQPRWFSATTGAFELRDVPAGKTLLRITGTEFVAEAREVTVDTKPTDLGTIIVTAGRAIDGTVVDRAGRGVGGATVILARELRADGTSLAPYPDLRALETVTRADGQFTLRGIGSGMEQIAADHETAGRSAMTTVPPGTTDLALTLTLVPPGVVQGVVRLDGKPAEALLLLRPEVAADSRLTVRTGGDGSYRFDRVAADRYTLLVTRLSGHRDQQTEGKAIPIEVKPGLTVTKDVDLTATGITAHLHVASPSSVVEFGYGVIAVIDDPALVTAALPKTISEGRVFGGKLGTYSMREGMIVSNRTIKFDNIPAGKHIACIAPLRGDPSDPAIVAEMQRGAADWPFYCKWITIAAAPDPQHVTVDVQPVPPLAH